MLITKSALGRQDPEIMELVAQALFIDVHAATL